MKSRAFASLFLAAGLAACGPANNGTNNGNGTNGVPDEPGPYEFPSRYSDGSSVSYSGQIARHLLIDDLTTFIGDLTSQIDSGDYQPGAEGSVVASLDFYYRFDSESYGDEPFLVSTEPPAMQESYADVSTGKDLVGKTAGNDSVTDHRDFASEFRGWSDEEIAQYGGSIDSPEGLVTAFFETIEQNAFDRADGVERTAPDGTELAVHHTAKGHDLEQLTQKFLLGAVAFHQAADDYLDDETEGKGLLAAHTRDEEEAFTTLEHAWDEGFGYFGAARSYLDYSDKQIADGVTLDANDDGEIDLVSEYNWGASVNAGKRDVGSESGTDLTGSTYEAFWRGRAILANAEETEQLSDDDLEALKAQRDQAIGGWEKALAATVVHYINDTIEQTNALGADEYDYVEHAKVWSEMKGFALAFQFNPRSPLADEDFDRLHTLLRDGPELDASIKDTYVSDLESARELLGEAYEFEQSDLEGW